MKFKNKNMFIIALAFILMIQSPTTYSATNVKEMTVQIPKGRVDTSTLTKTIEIPNLEKIVGVSVNTGDISYTVDGDKVTLTAKNGSPVSRINNSKKYSKSVTVTETSKDKLKSTINYNSNGYSGTLKLKESSVRDAKKRDSTTYNYRSYVSEGMAKEEESGACQDHAYWVTSYNEDAEESFSYLTWSLPGDYSVGYRELPASCKTEVKENRFGWTIEVTLTAQVPDGKRGDYSGTVYKPGVDKYYSYTATVKYIDNSAPEIFQEKPENININNNNVKTYDFNIPVKDIDQGDSLTVYYSLDGKTHSEKPITANGSRQNKTVNVNLQELKEGEHEIKFWVKDQHDDKSKEIVKTIIIDNIAPEIRISDVKK